jgi:uncharacterized protein YqjF (DUF2071 family)
MGMTTGSPDFLRALVDTLAASFVHGAGRHLETDRLPPDDHRPWRVPRDPWVMAQRWDHLAFAHWPVDAGALRALVPAALPLDTFDGAAWLGITPFQVRGLRLRGLPALPGLSEFTEINVRTYVSLDDKPGVYFFSLDANTMLGVQGARTWYRLPYDFAASALALSDDGIEFTSTRLTGETPAAFRAVYRPTGPVEYARRRTLEWWLTERYCLYAVDEHGRVERAEIHHAPWPLQRASVEIGENSMAEPLGLALSGPPALVHYSRTIDVSVWRPRRIRRRTVAPPARPRAA